MALLFQITQTLSGFLEAWRQWPRKDKKIDAEKAWHQKVKTPEIEQKVFEALEWQVPMLEQREPQYRPLFGSWLRGEEWNNEKPTPAKPPATTPSRTIEQLPDWQRRALHHAPRKSE